MTPRDLAVAQRELERAQQRVAQLLERRDALLVEALAAGFRQAQIARATGLTRGRIAQLALRAR